MLKKVVWGAVFPIVIILISLLVFLIKKKWYYLILSSALFIKITLVFLTDPAGWLMYYLSFYFLGYTLLVYTLLYRHFKTGLCPYFIKKVMFKRS